MSAVTAALLCAAITSRRDARIVRELRRASLEVLARARTTTAQRHAAQADAERLWDLVAEQPEGDRVPVLVALARGLLVDADTPRIPAVFENRHFVDGMDPSDTQERRQ